MAAPLFLGLSIYLWIALVSFILLAVLAVTGAYGFGGDGGADAGGDFGDFGGPGVSPLSLPLVAAFGTSFGVFGALLDLQGFSVLASSVGGVLGASAIAFGLFYGLQRFLARQQTSSDVQPDTLVGRDAQVMVSIRPDAPGQILVITPERGRSLFSAVSQEDIPRDATVQVLGFSGGVANVRKKLG